MLFSGGLDSLGGAIDELAGHGRDVALVSHELSPKMYKRQRQLAAELTNRFPGRVLHVPVRVTRQGLGALETTQRTRTLLVCVPGDCCGAHAGPKPNSFFRKWRG